MIGSIGYIAALLSVPEEFCFNLANMVAASAYQYSLGVKVLRSKKSSFADARNELVEKMEGRYLLQIDTDQEISAGTFARMYYTMSYSDLDVLSGITVSGAEPHLPSIFHWTPEEEAYYPQLKLERIGNWDDSGLFKVGSAGGGCFMVHRRVFDRIRKELKCKPFDLIPGNNEDHSFYLRLRELDINVWVDPTLDIPHYRLKGYSLADYRQYLKETMGYSFKQHPDGQYIISGEVKR